MSGRALGQRLHKTGALFIVLVAYVIAVGGAWLVAQAFGFHRPVWALGLGYGAATLIIYGWSCLLDNASMFDPWWSVLPAAAAVWLSCGATAGVPTLRIILVLVTVWVWAVRLTLNWIRGWAGLHHEDWRYLDLYTKGPKYLMSLSAVRFFPTFIVFLVSVPMVPALVWGHNRVSALDWIALALGLSAAAMQLIADEQMRAFRRQKQSGAVMDRGLWRYSRHPNYFGEVLLWWSIWLFALSADPAWWWTVVGPIAVTVMMLAASIPMLDERSRARRPEFEAYAKTTSAFVPWPPKKLSAGNRPREA